MSTTAGRVSAVIPAFNAEATIAATLASVQAQTYSDLDIVVVDDGSTDATSSIVAETAERDSRVSLIRQQNGGVAAARNAGIEAATGDWVAPIDADDLWHPRKIELQMQAAADAPGLVYSWSRRIDREDRVIFDLGRPSHRGDVFVQLVASNFLRNASSALLRKDAILAAGGFDASLQAAGAHGAEDIKLYLAVAEAERVELAPYFLTGYRQTAGSMSRGAARMRQSIEMVLVDVETRRPDLPRRLFDMARMNYDLYAASLSLAGGSWSQFLGFLAAGARRAPAQTATLLGCNVVWRIASSWRAGNSAPKFQDMGPKDQLPMPLMDWFQLYEARSALRAANHARLPAGVPARSKDA